MKKERVTIKQWLAKPVTATCDIDTEVAAVARLKKFFYQHLTFDHLNQLETKLVEVEGAKVFSPFTLELTIEEDGCRTDWDGIQALAQALAKHLPSPTLTQIFLPQV